MWGLGISGYELLQNQQPFCSISVRAHLSRVDGPRDPVFVLLAEEREGGKKSQEPLSAVCVHSSLFHYFLDPDPSSLDNPVDGFALDRTQWTRMLDLSQLDSD